MAHACSKSAATEQTLIICCLQLIMKAADLGIQAVAIFLDFMLFTAISRHASHFI